MKTLSGDMIGELATNKISGDHFLVEVKYEGIIPCEGHVCSIKGIQITLPHCAQFYHLQNYRNKNIPTVILPDIAKEKTNPC